MGLTGVSQQELHDVGPVLLIKVVQEERAHRLEDKVFEVEVESLLDDGDDLGAQNEGQFLDDFLGLDCPFEEEEYDGVAVVGSQPLEGVDQLDDLFNVLVEEVLVIQFVL